MKKAFAVVAAASMLFVAACGGDDGRPSADEIASGLRTVAESEQFTAASGGIELNDEFIDCWAEGIYDNDDVSDETAREVADGNADYQASDEQMQALTEPVMDCTDHLTP